MDQGILEVTNYADEAEMEFHCSILPSETHPGPWVFTLRQIKTLCQDISQESFWYPRHETFITSPKLIEKFHDGTQIKHEVNALLQSHWDPQRSENAQRLGATLHGQDVTLQEQDPGLSVQREGSSTSGTTFPVNAFSKRQKCIHCVHCGFTITVPWQLQH